MTEETMKAAIKEALSEQLGEFFIEREQHFLDHQFVYGVRTFEGKIREQACSVVTKVGITGLIALLLYGLIFWIQSVVGGHK
jgi:hypothetical protein